MRVDTGRALVCVHRIHLHGELADRFGPIYELGVNTSAQAIRALCVLKPGFREVMSQGAYRLVRGNLDRGIDLTETSLQMRLGGHDLHVIPMAAGAKTGGVVKMVLGAVILGAALFFAPEIAGPTISGAAGAGKSLASTAFLGLSYGQLALTGGLLFFAGVTAALSPQPKKPTQNNPSFLLSGQLNTTQQGVPVPVVYGLRMRVGSVTVSSGYSAEDYSGPAATTATSGGSAALDSTGAGGGGSSGGKGKGGSGSSTGETPDTLQSKAIVRIIDLISEGPIGGLFNGPQSIFFDGTPLMAADGTYNFLGVTWQMMLGLPDQDPVPGFPASEETIVLGGGGIQVLYSNPHVETIISSTATSLIVTVQLPSLFSEDANTGVVSGTTVAYKFEVQAVDGPWQTVVNEVLNNQKCTSPYQRSYRFELPGPPAGSAGGAWAVRMTRLTPDSTDATLQNDTYWFAYDIVTDYQLIYPNSAYMALTIDASAFGSEIPTRQYEVAGLLVQIPANFNPTTRTYATSGTGTTGGVWDGSTFTTASTDDPCWNVYDLLTNDRYGMSQPASAVVNTKFDLYTISQYCIASVPDGFGGTEPRYTMNCVLATQDDAFKVIQSMVSNFRGMVSYGGGQIMVSADMPGLPVKIATQANVIDGDFTYEGTTLTSRHTVARATYFDASNYFQQTTEVYENTDALSLRGQQPVDVVAFGATSRGQAHRVARWMLDTEQTQTETVTYKAGLYHLDLRPGDLIEQSDPAYAGLRLGGRIRTGSTASTLLLDTLFTPDTGATYSITVVMPNGALPVNSDSGSVSVSVPIASFATSSDGTYTIANLADALPANPNPGVEYLMTGSDISPRMFTVVGVQEPQHGQFAVTALYYDPGKFDRVEEGLTFNQPAFAALPSFLATAMPSVTNITVTDFLVGVGTTTIIRTLVGFTPVTDVRVTGYQVRAVSDAGFTGFFNTTGAPATIDNLDAANYVFSIATMGANNAMGPWVSAASVTIDGSPPTPDTVTGLTATGGVSSIALSWTEPDTRAIDTYQIQRKLHPTGSETVDPASSGATLLTTVSATSYTDVDSANLTSGVVAAYWVAAITVNGVMSGWTGPVRATAGSFNASNLTPGSIDTTALADSAVGSDQIADGSVTSSSSSNASDAYTPPDTWTDVLSVTVDVPSGANVLVMMKVIASFYGETIPVTSETGGGGGEGGGPGG
jgi:predicted phage tail protein